MQNIQERILKNLNEFTDDVILSDGTIGPISGSDADCTFDEDEIAEYGKVTRGIKTGYDVAHLMRDVAYLMQDKGDCEDLHKISRQNLRDINGNVVGHYEVV